MNDTVHVRANKLPAGLRRDLSVQENRLAPPYRTPDLAAEGRADVRARLVALVEVWLLQRERRCRVDQHEVRLVADGQRRLVAQSESAAPARSPPDSGDSRQRQTAHVMAAIEQHGERGLDARDAAPCRHEITLLHRRLRRRVIGGDDVDATTHEFVPQRLAIGRGPDWRGAFRHGAQPLDVLLAEPEIVGAGFDRHVHAHARALQRPSPHHGRS